MSVKSNTESQLSEVPLHESVIVKPIWGRKIGATGMYSEILGPVLPSLMERTHATFETIGVALSLRAFGYFVGSTFGAYLADKFYCYFDWLMAMSLIVSGGLNLVVPICKNVLSLSLTLFAAGISHGTLTTAGNPYLGQVWQDKASGPFNLMHAGYGLGGAVAPILVSHFTYTYENKSTGNVTNFSYIEAPFGVSTGLNASCAICFICFFFWNKYTGSTLLTAHKEEQEKRGNFLETDTQFYRKRRFCIDAFLRILRMLKRWYKASNLPSFSYILMILTLYFGILGNERVFGKYMYAYATEGPVQLDVSHAFTIQAVYWSAFSFSRVLMFLLTFKISIAILFIIQLIGTVVSSGLLSFAPVNKISFAIYATLFGFFKSPLFPSTLGVLSKALPITGFITLFVNMGGSVGAVLMQYVAGYIIEYHGQRTFPLIVFATSCFLLVIGSIYTKVVESFRKKSARMSEKLPLCNLSAESNDVNVSK